MEEIPDCLKTDMDVLLKQTEEITFRGINDRYRAKISPSALEIYDTNEVAKNPLFSDNLNNIRNNFCVHPRNPNLIYYCRTENPTEIYSLDLSNSPASWQPEQGHLLKEYADINNLALDPTGNFFIFTAGGAFKILRSDTLEELDSIRDVYHVHFDDQGRIRAINSEGKLVVYETNFEELVKQIEKEKAKALISQIDVTSLFKKAVTQKGQPTEEKKESFAHLQELKSKISADSKPLIEGAQSLEALGDLSEGLKQLSSKLIVQGLNRAQIEFITGDIEGAIEAKKEEMATSKVTEVLSKVRQKITGQGLSLRLIEEIRTKLSEAENLKPMVAEATKGELSKLTEEFNDQCLELFKKEGAEIATQVQDTLSETRATLDKMTKKSEFDDWIDYALPQLKSRLIFLNTQCPLEAREVRQKIIFTLQELDKLAKSYQEKFKSQYEQIREQAAERISQIEMIIKQNIESFLERLKSKKLADRAEAENFIQGVPAYKEIEAQIGLLERQDPLKAKDLSKSLKVAIANLFSEIERGALSVITETGQQMEPFGKVLFPKWEAKVKEKGYKNVELFFAQSSGNQASAADDTMGHIGFRIITKSGEERYLRLWEDLGQSEGKFELGRKAKAVSPSKVSYAKFEEIEEAYKDWVKPRSKRKKALKEKQMELKQELEKLYQLKTSSMSETELEEWQEKRDELVKGYVDFYRQNDVVILKRIEKLIKNPTLEEETNGAGFVQKWKNHWVRDPETEADLEKMAKLFKQQLDQQEGCLNLIGHAGTGKDLRIAMFSALTHRPLFSIDCTKWTTEYELSEDFTLETENGASYTAKLPSQALIGIQTPGAIVYFNEFSAMPENAQIFLHPLLDEKRAITLKTESGKRVPVDPTVLLGSSLNPFYPGTFEPPFATKRRMPSIELEYPKLYKEKDPADPNPNPAYSVAEALRVAREVDSLSDYTLDSNLAHNEFVKIWDKHVNGINNDAPEITDEQKFDLEVIQCLVQFGNKLRENFITIFEKGKDEALRQAKRDALPVTQPLTGSEMRRCAYFLSEITSQEKATANPEEVARKLLKDYFLCHIWSKADRNMIITAMLSWSKHNRVIA
ncbi:AAA family ATPase [Candidatus Peregrinibacteria bacterium]|nr:AAA family ATPase [Candidatus Peregrinibacteria bacterium]